MPRPLVTGAAGFAGSHLVEHLLETDASLTAWSNPNGHRGVTSDPRVEWQAVDLLDREAVASAIAALQPSAIYHCAGIADVGGSWSRPLLALDVNVMGTHHLIEAVRLARLECPILVTGSALVYRQSAEPLTEASPLGPIGPYGISKLAQEMLAMQATFAPTLVTRPFNHAGPRQAPDYVTSAFARQIVEIERDAVEPVIHVGNLDSRRDITDVRDVVRAYRLLVERGQPRRPYNVCSGTAYRVGDLLDALVGLARVRVAIRHDPARTRRSDNPVVLGDRSRISDEVGWAPRIPLEQTLADLLDYWRQHPTPPAAS